MLIPLWGWRSAGPAGHGVLTGTPSRPLSESTPHSPCCQVLLTVSLAPTPVPACSCLPQRRGPVCKDQQGAGSLVPASKAQMVKQGGNTDKQVGPEIRR